MRTNISFLQNLLRYPDFVANRIDTHFVEEHVAELVASENVGARCGVFLPRTEATAVTTGYVCSDPSCARRG